MENGAETADEGVIALIAGAGDLDPARARAVLLALRDAGVLAVPPDRPLVPVSRENPKVDGFALDGHTPARATRPCTCTSPAGPDGVRTIARFRTDEGAPFCLVAGAWTDHLLTARVRRSYDDAGGRPNGLVHVTAQHGPGRHRGAVPVVADRARSTRTGPGPGDFHRDPNGRRTRCIF